jgi:hypothetical protein
MCFVFVWEQTATSAIYIQNCLVLITEMKSVYSAVRTGPLNEAVFWRLSYSFTHDNEQQLSCQFKPTWIMFEYTSWNKNDARNFSCLVSNLPRTHRNFTLQKAMKDSPSGLCHVRYGIRCRPVKSEGSPIRAPKIKNVITNQVHLLRKVKQQLFCEHGHVN